MNRCAQIKKWLSSYIDKELSNDKSNLVEEHARNCPSCQQELNKLGIVKQMLAGRKRKSLPPDYLLVRLREKISSAEHTENIQWVADAGNFSRRLIPVPLIITVVSVIFLLVSLRGYEKSNYLEEYIMQGNLSILEQGLLRSQEVTFDSAAKIVLGLNGNAQN
jgi:hypothetical protein